MMNRNVKQCLAALTREDFLMEEPFFEPEQLADLLRHTVGVDDYVRRRQLIEGGIGQILRALDLDPESEHLAETPVRVARMYLNELCSGYFQKPEEVLQVSFTEEQYDQMIFVDGIEVISLCSHHMVPFFGEARIGYLPDKRVVGLSKLSRIVKVFAARLQVQERLTEQIASALFDTLKPKGVGVFIKAQHLCSCIRGVKNKDMQMKTVAIKGMFIDDTSVKEEFMELCRKD